MAYLISFTYCESLQPNSKPYLQSHNWVKWLIYRFGVEHEVALALRASDFWILAAILLTNL